MTKRCARKRNKAERLTDRGKPGPGNLNDGKAVVVLAKDLEEVKVLKTRRPSERDRLK